jgi:hypothetical protein
MRARRPLGMTETDMLTVCVIEIADPRGVLGTEDLVGLTRPEEQTSASDSFPATVARQLCARAYRGVTNTSYNRAPWGK